MNPKWSINKDYITLCKYSKNIFGQCFSFQKTKEGHEYWAKLWGEYGRYLSRNSEI